jgi:hypothetical protein
MPLEVADCKGIYQTGREKRVPELVNSTAPDINIGLVFLKPGDASAQMLKFAAPNTIEI